MTRIRVGLVGLSSLTTSAPATGGDGWAASAHLPYLLSSPLYQIVALCNSSPESAAKAIEKHGLPPSTKRYGTTQGLADDPEVQLVVCCVRVDRHYELMMPVLKAGKDVYIEWPLGSNLQQANEMLATAKESGSRTVVGLQSRYSPVTRKIKQLLAENAIGRLLSSTTSYDVATIGYTDLPGVDYMSKKSAGGNLFTIMFAHTVDAVSSALGELQKPTAMLTTQWPQVRCIKPDGSFDRMIKREVPDHVALQARLKATGTPISITVRGGNPFKDESAFCWRLIGTDGEIRITSSALISLELGSKIELYKYQKDSVEVMSYKFPEHLIALGPTARNIGGIYDLFATGGGVVTFKDAVLLHEFVEGLGEAEGTALLGQE